MQMFMIFVKLGFWMDGGTSRGGIRLMSVLRQPDRTLFHILTR